VVAAAGIVAPIVIGGAALYGAVRPRSFAELASDTYPIKAIDQKVEGKVMLDCVADPDFRPRNCQITSEIPLGYGFGAAALKIAANSTLSEKDRARVEPGTRFSLPIGFRLPQQPHPTKE
jgi:hypothetical protein